MAKVHKVYEPEFKEMIVRLVLDEGRTIKSVNKEYNLGEGTVRSWIKRFEEECASNPEKQDQKELYEENRLLRNQLAEAKKENEFLIPQGHLEKATAFFAKDIV